ncbi:MAG TPA: hypothetical protein ENH55_10570 [Aurantimonas coralicida]|uniref:Uncharacterized protein n=2 Tax=root TaxID=1 RepID=A0A9C9NCW4_9HYPH|nr:hypothetical protein [Aurantimonas coralicida]HET98917.1 hypothetical protein [Aurantimonas coralicida]
MKTVLMGLITASLMLPASTVLAGGGIIPGSEDAYRKAEEDTRYETVLGVTHGPAFISSRVRSSTRFGAPVRRHAFGNRVRIPGSEATYRDLQTESRLMLLRSLSARGY